MRSACGRRSPFPAGSSRTPAHHQVPGQLVQPVPFPGDLLVEEDDKTFNAGKQHELIKEAFKIVYQTDCETVIPVLEEAANGPFISCHYPPDTQGRGLAWVKPLIFWHPFGLMLQSPLNISADLIISYGGIRWLFFSASEPVMWAGPRWR